MSYIERKLIERMLLQKGHFYNIRTEMKEIVQQIQLKKSVVKGFNDFFNSVYIYKLPQKYAMH